MPARDELVVARLREAGAVRLGKTNVPEFAAGSHTFNPVFGVTRNPYDLHRSAGGSSGGAAAALASGMVPLAEGSDMGGSLRNPAAFCNVVGIRPTPGRVPSHPALLGGSTLGVQGPMARTVEDVALALSVLAGPDPRVQLSLHDLDPGSLAVPLPTDLHGVRVAWAPDLGGRVPVEPGVRDVLAGVPGVVAGLGATVSEDCPRLDGADEVFDVLRAWQFAATHADLVRRRPQDVKEAVRWNVERGLALSGEDVGRAEALRTKLFQRVVHFFDRYDVLLAPVAQVLPFDADAEYPTEVDGVPQESYLAWMRSCSIYLGDRVPRGLGAGRVLDRRPAGRPAGRGRAACRPSRAGGRTRLRAGDAPRPAPPRPLAPPVTRRPTVLGHRGVVRG